MQPPAGSYDSTLPPHTHTHTCSTQVRMERCACNNTACLMLVLDASSACLRCFFAVFHLVWGQCTGAVSAWCVGSRFSPARTVPAGCEVHVSPPVLLLLVRTLNDAPTPLPCPRHSPATFLFHLSRSSLLLCPVRFLLCFPFFLPSVRAGGHAVRLLRPVVRRGGLSTRDSRRRTRLT